MKTNERVTAEDHLLVVQQRHDVTNALKRAEMMRHAHEIGHSGAIPKDWEPIGVVPAIMKRLWAQEAGVRMDDAEAMEEVLMKRLLDGEFQKLQVKGR